MIAGVIAGDTPAGVIKGVTPAGVIKGVTPEGVITGVKPRVPIGVIAGVYLGELMTVFGIETGGDPGYDYIGEFGIVLL